MGVKFSVFLYENEYRKLALLAGSKTLSRAIALLIEKESTPRRLDPPEGSYISGTGIPYIIRHEEDPKVICFECKLEKPTKTCNLCRAPICDTDWGKHGQGCFTSPQHAAPGPVEGVYRPEMFPPPPK